MIVACLALIVAMGGSAYAALSKNSVKSKQIAPKAVGTSELAKSAVKGSKLADGAVTSAKIVDGAVATEDIAARSIKLEKLGISVRTYFADAPLPDDGTRQSAIVQCQAGQVPISGGASYNFGSDPGPTAGDDLTIISSRPAIAPAPGGFPDNGSSFNAWRVSAINTAGGSTGAIQVTSQVICLSDE